MTTLLLRPMSALSAALALAFLLPASARADADDVSVRAGTGLATMPFPSNRHTVFDGSQRTLRRVKLPMPDCTLRPSDCADVAVLNQLDGFSTQPRITVPFTGDIDLSTVTSDTVFLLNLGDTFTGAGAGERVGINQIVWDAASKTLAFQSNDLLQQHSRYVLLITNGVRDARGKKIKSGGWGDEFGEAFGRDRDGDSSGAEYRGELRSAVNGLRGLRHKVVASSVFTTQSITPDLQKINRAIKLSMPAPVDFNIGLTAAGPVRAVFPVGSVAGIQFHRQTGAAPAFTDSFVPTPALGVAPGAVALVAYGRFSSPDYQTAGKLIPATGTLTGQPQPQGSNPLILQVFVPAGAKPAGGWPVAMFGHGFTDSMYGAPWTVAATLASRGIATVSINVVGHGGGAQGTLNVFRSAALPVVVPAGGRGIDQDGNGNIDSTEGVNAAAPAGLVASRDGLRQTVIDYMQLVRQIEAGVDVDGDGSVDLDANRIYYAGQSFGGIYGTILLGSEPNIKAGVPNVPGGSITEIARISPAFRGLTGLALLLRQPVLLNLAPTAALPVPFNFNENMPLRDQPPVVNTVPGAMEIQSYIDRSQWATQAGNPVSYAAYIRKQPLPGHVAKPVIVQFAQGDMTVPNPTTTAILRAGGLADRATRFRNDLAFAGNNAFGRNPHTFLSNIGNAVQAPAAVMAQTQMAIFFATGGALTIDPDGAGLLFEVPTLALPEGLNFIP